MGRKSASGSGIRDEQPGSFFLELRNHFFGFFGVKILKFFDAGSGMETVRIRDPGWKKVGSGINIPDSQHCCRPKFVGCFLGVVTVMQVQNIFYYKTNKSKLSSKKSLKNYLRSMALESFI